ncbi:hypothetical protein RRG08_055931 [Elysia crispata]|uniref:Uncharacterized protein n=1 Tax=Elysia crispata TaxID=231223 RepID=A0AAE1DX31_9GAST|nr:hypothetical protein RRG08_055931 [Elysia crispata]
MRFMLVLAEFAWIKSEECGSVDVLHRAGDKIKTLQSTATKLLSKRVCRYLGTISYQEILRIAMLFLNIIAVQSIEADTLMHT